MSSRNDVRVRYFLGVSVRVSLHAVPEHAHFLVFDRPLLTPWAWTDTYSRRWVATLSFIVLCPRLYWKADFCWCQSVMVEVATGGGGESLPMLFLIPHAVRAQALTLTRHSADSMSVCGDSVGIRYWAWGTS